MSFGAAILFNVTLAASVCGTFAWYTYATRTGLEKQYHGTTVGDMGSLQAGLVSDVRLENFLEYDLAEDDRTLADEGKIIYWCKERIEPDTIAFVVEANGYASSGQLPVTTGEFDFESDNPSDFELYRRPAYKENYSTSDPGDVSDKSAYTRLNFVFRFEDIDNIGEYLPGYDVFLSRCDLETSDPEHEIYKSARIYFRNGNEHFLINPTSETDGEDIVGGVLDLDQDGFYDYDDDGFEILYGEANFFEYNTETTAEDGDLPWRERDTFIANHKKGVYAVNEESIDPKSVKYININRFISKSKAITSTDPDYHNLGRFDMFIYFEGWDRHLVDSEQGYGYNLDLTFSVQL